MKLCNLMESFPRSAKSSMLGAMAIHSVTAGVPAPELLDEIVRRTVAVAHPERIILFGSGARGEMGPNSDVDLLVVKANADRRATARAIRRALVGLGVPKDIVVVTPEDIQWHKDDRGLVIYPALRDGKILYAAHGGARWPGGELASMNSITWP